MGHIYWIASYPKSGNTWMRSFLQALVGPRGGGGINELWQFAPDENLGNFYQPLLGKPMAQTAVWEQAAVRPAVQLRIAAAVDGFQFLKTHSMYARHAGTPTINPAATAGAIYIVRNPLDVVVSYSRFRNRSIAETIGVLNEPGRLLPRNEAHAYVPCGSWAEHVTSWTRTPSERLLVLRYEDMLEHPRESFGKVAALLKADVSPQKIDEAIERTSFGQLQQQEALGGFVERPGETQAFFRKGEAGQWRDNLNWGEVAAITRPNRSIMRAFGYWQSDFDNL